METTDTTSPRRFRSRRVLIPAGLAVLALGAGGVAFAATTSGGLDGSERDRVAAAATQAAGGGQAVEVERSDDRGEAYEVEVRRADGSEVEVTLDRELAVLAEEADDDRTDRDDSRDESRDPGDSGDRITDAAERTRVEKAAVAAVGGGTVTESERSDDRGEAYEVEVRKGDGSSWDVTLGAGLEVLGTARDD